MAENIYGVDPNDIGVSSLRTAAEPILAHLKKANSVKNTRVTNVSNYTVANFSRIRSYL